MHRDERQPVLPLHPVPSEIDAQARLRQLRRHLVRREGYRPCAVGLACVCSHTDLRPKIRVLGSGPMKGWGATRRTIEAQVVLLRVRTQPQQVLLCAPYLQLSGANRGSGAAHSDRAHAPSVNAVSSPARRASQSAYICSQLFGWCELGAMVPGPSGLDGCPRSTGPPRSTWSDTPAPWVGKDAKLCCGKIMH